MCHVVLHGDWPQGLGKETRSGETRRMRDALNTMVGTIVRLLMPNKASLLRQGESIRQDVVDQKTVIVHWDDTKKGLKQGGKRLAESVRVGLG